LKYDKEDPNVIYTGGWDYRVVVWDVRDRKPKKNGKIQRIISLDMVFHFLFAIGQSSFQHINKLLKISHFFPLAKVSMGH